MVYATACVYREMYGKITDSLKSGKVVVAPSKKKERQTGRYKTRTGSDRINSDQSGSDQVGSTQIDKKINKLRNISNFYLIVGLIPLRNGPFTRHFDF